MFLQVKLFLGLHFRNTKAKKEISNQELIYKIRRFFRDKCVFTINQRDCLNVLNVSTGIGDLQTYLDLGFCLSPMKYSFRDTVEDILVTLTNQSILLHSLSSRCEFFRVAFFFFLVDCVLRHPFMSEQLFVRIDRILSSVLRIPNEVD